MSSNSWKTRAQTDLGVVLDHWQSLAGGDFAQSYTATVISTSAQSSDDNALQPGTRLFIKTHGSPPPNHFSTEARGLQWLTDSGTVNVPTVLGVDDEAPYLAIAWIEESRQRSASEQDEREFGRQLAQLHDAECASFGREDKRSTGSQGLPNQPLAHWADFYGTQRLLPLATLAAERQALSNSIINDIESLAARLDEWVPADVKPSRLHGDLWAGNRLVDVDGKSWLIDPASHGGHREFDLAMMRLFGGFGEACFDGYQEISPLDAGWQDRVSLHQLAPLIVHAIKFGSAYVGPTQEALSRYC